MLELVEGDVIGVDSAAGDAIIHAAGGSVLDLSGKRLLYGLNEDFINPYFIAKA